MGLSFWSQINLMLNNEKSLLKKWNNMHKKIIILMLKLVPKMEQTSKFFLERFPKNFYKLKEKSHKQNNRKKLKLRHKAVEILSKI